MDVNKFQRIGAISNAHAGRDFEESAKLYWARAGVQLQRDFPVKVGYKVKKDHRFDLGSEDPPVLVECKSYTWTASGNSPSAKIRSLNEVMLLFSVSPQHYRKVLFVLKHMRGEVSLAGYYVRTQGHLIGPNVEVWEFDPDAKEANRVL